LPKLLGAFQQGTKGTNGWKMDQYSSKIDLPQLQQFTFLL